MRDDLRLAPGDLPEPLTLRLYDGARAVFESDRHWLHPLFDLAPFLAGADPELPARARLVDRVTGRAAAFLLARLGIRELHTGLLSRRAVPVLERFGVRTTCAGQVDRILCATEDELAAIEDPELAWSLLQARRGRALAALSPGD